MRASGRYGGSLAVWMLLVAYASLYPFLPLRLPAPDALGAFAGWPRYVIGFDIVLNVVAYLPLGIFACLYFSEGSGRLPAILKATALGASFSFAMETCQLFIPYRISSVQDILANTGGTLAGALLFTDPVYSLATRPLGALRERLVVAGPWGDAALMLVLLWLISQLNPALPFFGAGNIVDPAGMHDVVVLQWAAVAISVCGFGLFVASILKAEHGSLRMTLVLLSIALWLKFMAASFMLQPHFATDWMTAHRVLALAGGIAVFILLRRLARLARIYLALLLVLAGALFSKIFGAYSALDELLKLFRWPYGQLAGFTTLTRFIHEGWPFLTLVFLIALFFHERGRQQAGRMKA